MFLWRIEFEENWTFNEKNEYNNNGAKYNVVANDADEAVAKARKLVMSQKSFKDDNNPKITHKILSARVVTIERKDFIDA